LKIRNYLLLCSALSMSTSMSMIRSVEQVYHQNFINLHMCKSLLEHDGAHLKKILVLDKDGFCSSDIALAEVALKESKIDFLGMIGMYFYNL